MRATAVKWLVVCLREELPKDSMYFLAKEEAYHRLKEETGKDFGMDGEAWEGWAKKHNKWD